MSSKQLRRKESGHRASAGQLQSPTKEIGSLAASAVLGINEHKRGKFPIWPEWNEADVNAEKWDMGKGTKEKDKAGKSPGLQFFDDPEGKIELPPGLKVHSWKRPLDCYSSMTPVIMKDDTSFDLLSSNGHLFSCEFMRWFISEIYSVWRSCNLNVITENGKASTADPSALTWKPWEHIYAHCKAIKGHVPQYNSYGKYVVRLYWMGCWRKITVDDTLPFNEENHLLLPTTTFESELWPMILCKAIMKLANVDTNGYERLELGEFTVMHSLTGWLPEVIPLCPQYTDKVWCFLKEIVTEFRFAEDESIESQGPGTETQIKEDKAADMRHEGPAVTKLTEKISKDKLETKDAGKKKGEKEKTKGASHSSRPLSEIPNAQSFHEGFSSSIPQMVVYASFLPLHVSEKKITLLGRMADSSEKLRMYGLCHTFSHPVLVTRVRSCSLITSQKPSPLPNWKLVRPKKEVAVTSEIKEPVVKKPDQFIEIASPFLNLKQSHSPLRSDVKAPPILPRLAALMEYDGHHRQRNLILRQSIRHIVEEEDEEVEPDYERQNMQEVRRSSGASFYDGRVSADGDAVDSASPSIRFMEESNLSEAKIIIKEIWIDFEAFCTCFQTLYIFHKPNTYQYSCQKSDLKSLDDQKSYYLFVDNLKPTEILVSYSALVRWGDSGSTQKDGLDHLHGLLLAEHFSWKSLSTGPVALKIKTCATKATILNLPPGRNVLHFTARSPVGHHIHLCSTVPFVFGEEETVMPHLEKESYRFIEHAKVIMKSLGNVIDNFSNEEEFPRALKKLDTILCPHPYQISTEKVEEYLKAFNSAFWHLITKEIGSDTTPELIFATKALTKKITVTKDFEDDQISSDSRIEIRNLLQNRTPSSSDDNIEGIVEENWETTHLRKLNNARISGTEDKSIVTSTLRKLWMIIETNYEYYAIALLRHIFKYNSKICQIYPCFEDENIRVSFHDYTVTYVEQPANTWFVVFREVFHLSEDMLLVPKMYCSIPVCILHIINNDTMEEIPRVFHKVPPQIFAKNMEGYTFMAEASTGDYPVMAGKWRMRLIGSSQPLPSLSREIINSSFAVKEIKDYFIPNKKQIVLRYGVKVDCDLTATVQVQTSKSDVFIKVQILENEEEVVKTTGKGHAVIPAFRFCFQSKERDLSSQSSRSEALGASSSKKDNDSSNVSNSSKRSSNLENGQDVHDLLSDVAIEHALTPLPTQKYIIQVMVLHNSWSLTESQLSFIQELKEVEKNENKVFGEKLAQEELYVQGSTEVQPTAAEGQKSASTPKTSRKGREKSSKEREKEKEKEKEKEREKEREREREKEKLIAAKLESQACPPIDTTKPHWILRVVTEQNEADALELKKDTDKVDDIKAMKQAWESTEPGRAVKAMQARLQFINKHMDSISAEPLIKPGSASTTDETGKDVVLMSGQLPAASVTFSDRRRQSKKHEWEPLDLTQYMRKTMPKAVIKDESFILQQQMQKTEEIRQFRHFREHVLEQREKEQEDRYLQKKTLLEMYENMQISLDTARNTIFSARESFRRKLIEAEMKRQESAGVQRTPSPVEQVKPVKRKRSGKKKKK